MSSILKALRKIEEEKRVAKHKAPDLRVDQGLVSLKSWPFLPLLVGVVFGAVLVGVFFLWSSKDSAPVAESKPEPKTEEIVVVDKQDQKTLASSQVHLVVDSATTGVPARENRLTEQARKELAEIDKVSVVIMSPEPVTVAENRKAITVISTPTPTATPAPTATTAPTATPAPAPAPTATPALAPAPTPTVATIPTPTAKASIQKAIEPEKATPEATIVASTPSNTIQAMPAATASALSTAITPELPEGVSLLVAEIFYQDNSTNSMAVVNDLPVMVGTQVDDAIVTEIRPEHVLFKIGDKTYIVPGVKQ